jgi:predicted metal-binding protein
VSKFNKYIQVAKELKMSHAMVISSEDIFFDIRAKLKCRWGCEDFFKQSVKCHTRNTSFQERIEMIKAYQKIVLIHSHDASALSKAVLEIEKMAFLDGYYFAFAVRYCNLCKNCSVDRGDSCPTPEKVRPCDQSFGIDVYKTVRHLGLPCEVLQSKEEVQNRYGFVLIE